MTDGSCAVGRAQPASCTRGYGGRPCKRRTCGPCSPLVARDWRRVFFANLEAYGGPVRLTAITAPGDEVLPRDRNGRCLRAPLEEWCSTMGERYSRLRDAAYRATKRELGRGPTLLCRAWEEQPKRGAPHVHPVLGVATPIERLAAAVFVRHLDRLAGVYGFGFVERKELILPPERAAAYLSSYLCTGKGAKLTVQEGFRSGLLGARPLWCSPRLTTRTGCTRRNLRRLRHLWAYCQGFCEAPAWWEIEAERDIVLALVGASNQPRAPAPRTG